MTRTDPDFPSIWRTTEDMDGLQAYLDEQRARRAAEAQPAVGSGVQLVVAFVLAFAVMLAVAFVIEVMP